MVSRHRQIPQVLMCMRYFLLLLLFCAPTLCADEIKIQQLIAQSGVRHLSVQATQVASLYSFTKLLEPASAQQAKQKIAQIWSSQALHDILQHTLKQATRAQINVWHKAVFSPTLRSFYALEKQAIKAQFSTQYQHYMLRLRVEPPTLERRQLSVDLLQAVKRFELLWLVRKASFDRLTATYGHAAIRLSHKQLKRKLINFYLYACRHLSAAQIKRIIREFQSPAIRSWQSVIRRSLVKHAKQMQ